MKMLINKLWTDESGFVISAELAMIATAGVLATVVGLNKVSSSVNHELNDFANAIGALDQSYCYEGFCHPGHSWVAGSGYLDTQDECDCAVLVGTHPEPKIDRRHRPGRGMHRHGDYHRKGNHDHKERFRKDNDREERDYKKRDFRDKKVSDKADKEVHHHHERAHAHHRHGFGGTRILRAENGRPLFSGQHQCCPEHPQTVLPCEKCRDHRSIKDKRLSAPRNHPVPVKPKSQRKQKSSGKNI